MLSTQIQAMEYPPASANAMVLVVFVAILVACVALLEVLCLTGVIDKLTMQPPHVMVMDIWRMLVSGSLNAAIAKTLGNSAIAFALAMIIGVASAIVIHRFKAMREALDPLFATYYAIPIFAFYPLLIILFGLGDAPEIFIGTMLGAGCGSQAGTEETTGTSTSRPRAMISVAMDTC